jgi:hypothetical protein
MAAEEIAIEVPLTSNELLLGARGPEHPILFYVRHGVPVVLATDDPGVFRTQLTREFALAATRYPSLSYNDFKRFARNSLHYSFAPGASLWLDARYLETAAPCAPPPTPPSEACARFLEANPRAGLEWRLEADLARFEASFP